jgi:hypothetical protein
MPKKDTFLDSLEWVDIVNNVKGIMTSDGTMATLLDFERVLDEADLYAFKNWKMGELVDGPVIGKYLVSCTFMWPRSMMPDPRAGRRLVTLGCKVKFKETSVEVPVEIKEPMDYKPGTHYPKKTKKHVWLVNITIPKTLMNDIREGSVDIAEQTIDLEDLDDAYQKDYDTEEVKGGGGGQPVGGPPMPPPAPAGPPTGGPQL